MSDLEEALNHIRVMSKANARWRRIARSTVSDLHTENMTLRSENSRLRTHWVSKYLEASDAADMLDELDAALNTIAKVETLHRHGWQEEPTGNGMNGEVIYERVAWCLHCDTESPCPTIRALGSVPSTGEGNE